MPEPITRPSLVSETTRAIRDAIRIGEYESVLPSERALCRALNVSRPTLRSALDQLEREGLIQTRGKAPRRILSRPTPRRRHAHPASCVRLLHVKVPEAYQAAHLERHYFLAEHLAQAGIDFHVESLSPYYVNQPDHALKLLAERNPADAWVLQSCSESVQRWFQSRRLNALVLGSAFDEVDFVSIDTDLDALGRHAAGMLRSRGHRALAVIHPGHQRAGDRHILDGFHSGADQSTYAETTALPVAVQETPRDVHKAVDRLLRHPGKPDGWLVINARCYIMAATYLARRGIRVGRDISLICSHMDPSFSAFTPTVAHYQRNDAALNRLALRLIQTLIKGGAPEHRAYLLQSKFIPGESLRESRK